MSHQLSFLLQERSLAKVKSPVKNYRTSDFSCQGSVQSADLHARDSNTSHIFHPGVREEDFFSTLIKSALSLDKYVTDL